MLCIVMHFLLQPCIASPQLIFFVNVVKQVFNMRLPQAWLSWTKALVNLMVSGCFRMFLVVSDISCFHQHEWQGLHQLRADAIRQNAFEHVLSPIMPALT